MEELILLKQYILNAPASQDEHQKALGWLQEVINQYKKEIGQLQTKIKENGE